MRHRGNEQGDEQHRAEHVDHIDPPLLAYRIEAVHELAELGCDERPAGADLPSDCFRQAIDSARAGPDGIDEQKFQRWPH